MSNISIDISRFRCSPLFYYIYYIISTIITVLYYEYSRYNTNNFLSGDKVNRRKKEMYGFGGKGFRLKNLLSNGSVKCTIIRSKKVAYIVTIFDQFFF